MSRKIEAPGALVHFRSFVGDVLQARREQDLVERARLLLAAEEEGRKTLQAFDTGLIAPFFQRLNTEDPKLGRTAAELLAATKVLPREKLCDLLGITSSRYNW